VVLPRAVVSLFHPRVWFSQLRDDHMLIFMQITRPVTGIREEDDCFGLLVCTFLI
jgi:hypothetical protein